MMFSPLPIWFVALPRGLSVALRSGVGLLLIGYPTTLHAQIDRQQLLEREPLAVAKVQSLLAAEPRDYAAENRPMMYRPEQEDPLSFYARTQDGEWLIPRTVDRDDPWVRLLVLAPGEPSLVDVAVEINGQPFRATREQWIDKLQAEAKAAFLVRAGAATAEAAGITETPPPTPLGEPASAGGEAQKEPAPEVPTVPIQGRRTRTLAQRLINVLAIDSTTDDNDLAADREQVRWLLAEWTGGPAQLTLSPAFAWRRADLAPLWQALDQDGDQVLSSAEITQATAALQQADVNRDDTIDLDELQRFAKKHPGFQRTNSHPLVVVIDEQTDWKSLLKGLRQAYATMHSTLSSTEFVGATLKERIVGGDKSLKSSELASLLSLPPDLVYRVAFGEKDAQVVLLSTGEPRDGGWKLTAATEQVLTVERLNTNLEFSAAQGKIDVENARGDMQQTQIAVGAVIDGYPLLRLLDHDNNQQLTLRERREVTELLRALDNNQDGRLERGEVPVALRLAVTLGPQAHRHLSKPIAAARKVEQATVAEVPRWFRDMDRNGDGDLSRREFKGTPQQFARLDRDGDGLIGHKEIQARADTNE